MNPCYYEYLDSPIGPLLLQADSDGLSRLALPRQGQAVSTPSDAQRDAEYLRPYGEQLQAYFQGRLQQFTLSLNARGTPFQRMVWQALCAIPYAQTRCYAELAEHLGRPRAVRAVAAAIGANPIPIVVPCHRVIGRNGTLTGYTGGLDAKRYLLNLEDPLTNRAA